MRLSSPTLLAAVTAACTLLAASCERRDCCAPDVQLPESYSAFANVSYEGQRQRLGMLGELKAYMRSAAQGVALDSARLRAMYGNEAGAGFSGSYTKDLRSKTIVAYREAFLSYLDRLALISALDQEATYAAAGIATSADGSKRYLLDGNGVEWAQVVEKGLMGACFYYQATSVYLGPDRLAADNTDVTPGEGTLAQHYWDEAFGYLGVPQDFPADTDGVVFWGDYCVDRDAQLGTNGIMRAFLAGRQRLVDSEGTNGAARPLDAVSEIKHHWEQVCAGSAVHYLNQALTNYPDEALRLHALSEAVAFAWSLQFSDERTLSREALNDWLTALAGAPDFRDMNLYNADETAITAARDALAAAHGFAAVAAAL